VKHITIKITISFFTNLTIVIWHCHLM